MKKIKVITSKFICVFVSMLSLTLPFFDILKVYATTSINLIITADGVRVRSVPSAVSSTTILGRLDTGDVITVLDTESTVGKTTNCSSDSWHKIEYNSGIGYVCSTYTAESYTDPYQRPWTTPKKSVVGGAKYIARNYVAQGQFTSYLKKFNVNPDSAYALYRHQYMTNIRAVYNEAYLSYRAYNDNGLLEQPLVFNIPIFNNMPEYTTLPNGEPDTSGQTEVTDPTFEAALDAQGFPEPYKKKLRLLHASYNNWTFEALKTGLDWNESVAAEQPVSYIDDSNGAYRAVNSIGNYILKEGNNWYLANSQTTAYFLDPRNFLNIQRILMFEKLSYSAQHTAPIIQTLLNSTFMEGLSVPDNQTYASIFVEAGQEANVSSIYLASLAIQESGVSGSLATSGNEFTYKNVTYKGLYNIFNIGASSSELSPVRAGMVWANGGSTATVIGNVVPIEKPSYENNYLNRLGLTKTSTFITGLNIESTVASVKNKLTDLTVTVSNSSGNVLSNDDRVGTGNKIVISDGTNSYTNTVVIYGDLNGDGAINASDLLYMRKYLLKTIDLSGPNFEAAKIAKGTDIGAADLLYLRKYLLDSNTYKITQ
ncbi:MAG: dockerin type I domain-containing protein [Bacilli bacterium]|nr:dockerin type I domain-containing protein [Bacilli bacterium]MDD3305353.1 dockerin type I domain-containing protein [Bacilli bacterium]MDD4053371.1 dockerin type I domain-containing protein [Bacilli bacterium]MDD4410982.1 dockerin type I domain-containing protein [Bacilli bacterium]